MRVHYCHCRTVRLPCLNSIIAQWQLFLSDYVLTDKRVHASACCLLALKYALGSRDAIVCLDLLLTEALEEPATCLSRHDRPLWPPGLNIHIALEKHILTTVHAERVWSQQKESEHSQKK